LEYQHIRHCFEPVYDSKSRVLILGSLPSAKSREEGFYYGHRQNRFWKVISLLCECPLPVDVEHKRSMLLEQGIALWDVISECDIIGSDDSSIRNVIPADIASLLSKTDIKAVFVNGGKASAIYDKYQFPLTGLKAVKLPSTSPANAAWSLDRLLGSWSIIKKYL